MTDQRSPGSELILYQTEDGRTRVQCRFEDETLWLTQIQLAELFQTSVANINIHLKAIYAEAELMETATIKSYLIVRSEGSRQVSRDVLHYSLPAILAVGFRVRSQRGTQFRQWATARLSEYLVKGFTMDDERLKNSPGAGQRDYFDELLERIRDIHSSERRFYQKVLDIYVTSVDYTPHAALSEQFFATVQNKMHFATHGHTAAEIIHERADADKPLMGLLSTRACAASDDATAIRDDVAFCQAVKSALAKSSGGSGKSPDQLDAAVRQLVSKAIIADGQVIDVFTAAGLPKPDISILSDPIRSVSHRRARAQVQERRRGAAQAVAQGRTPHQGKAQPRAVGVLQRETEEDTQRLPQPRHRDAGSDRRVDQAGEGDRRGRKAR